MTHPISATPMARRVVHVRLRADVDQRVAELAEREGNTPSAVVRRLISEALRRPSGRPAATPTPTQNRLPLRQRAAANEDAPIGQLAGRTDGSAEGDYP
jgi:hypothetical protein